MKLDILKANHLPDRWPVTHLAMLAALHGPGSLPAPELSARVGRDKVTVVKHLRALASARLVTLEQGRPGGRKNREPTVATLTDKGRQFIESLS